MNLPSPLCLLRSLYRSLIRPGTLWYGHAFSGHELQDTEIHAGCTVIVSRCNSCGAQDISWHHGAPAAHETAEPGCCGRAPVHAGS